MLIAVKIDPTQCREWQARLAEALAADGHGIILARWTSSSATRLRGAELLLSLERLIYRPTADLFARIQVTRWAAFAGSEKTPDLTLDLTEADPASQTGPCLTIRFDNASGEVGLLGALLDGHAPNISVAATDARGTRILASGLPAVEDPRVLGAGLDAVLVRAIGLTRQAVRNLEANGAQSGRAPTLDVVNWHKGPLRFGFETLSRKVAGRLSKLAGHNHLWQTGWRVLDALDPTQVHTTLAWPENGYRWLADDGLRYYADPFVFTHAGRSTLFVEEYPYATGIGLISAVEITREGPVGTPCPVLERPYHVSYPNVFAHGGVIYMIPETSGNGTIEIYRADPFPDRWVLDRVLVEGVEASDPTLLEHNGDLYLFATTREGGGSTWDQLSIFHAAHLHGPWRAHPGNPVLIDAGLARPAGLTFFRNSALIRPVQDCRSGYGVGLAFCRIDRLDTEHFSQTLLGRLPPDKRWNASGVHTLNVGGGFEMVDRFVTRWRSPHSA